MPTTPRPAKRVRIEIPDSATTYASAQSVLITPPTFRYRPQTDVNSITNAENVEPVLNTVLNAPDSPLRTFTVPEALSVLAEGISETVDLSATPIWSPPRLSLPP